MLFCQPRDAYMRCCVMCRLKYTHSWRLKTHLFTKSLPDRFLDIN